MEDKTELVPEYIWFNGEIIPWNEARVHIWSEVAIRGANVFDGLRAYWNPENKEYYVLAMQEHIERLFQSAKLLKFPSSYSEKQIIEGIYNLVKTLDYREHTLIRPTIYIDNGRYGSDPNKTKMGAYIVAFPVPHSSNIQTGIRCCISSWNRLSENNLSPLIKAGASYLSFRLPKIEANENGYDDVILLNNDGTVSEAAGATVFLVKNGEIFTPSIDSNILDSITRKKVIELTEELFHKKVQERKIQRTELYCADEVFLCGTLAEILPVIDIDGYKIGTGKVGDYTKSIIDRFLGICVGGDQKKGWLDTIRP